MFKRISLGAIVAVAIMFMPYVAQAQSIGVVDVQKILQTTAAGKNIHDQLESKRKAYQKEISAKETSLRKLEKSILDEKANLSEDEFNEKRKEFEQEVLKTQKVVQNNKRSLEAGFTNGLAKLRDEVRTSIEVIAKERNFDMVISQENVIIAQPSMDITDAVIKALDKRVSKVDIDWSAPKN